MTTSTWTVGSGNWNDGSSWSAGIPAFGDVAVINDAAVTLTSSMVTAGTLDGVTLDLNPISGLSFNVTDVTFGPASAIDLTGPVTLDSNGQVVSAGAAIIGTDATAGVLTLNLSHAGVHAPLFTNNGSMVVTAPIGGDSQIDINPVDPGATFTNAGQITLTISTVLNDDPGNSLTPGLLVNSGTISFLGDGVTAVNTHGEFTDPLDNTGTIIINGGGTLDPTLTFTDFLGQLSGNGTVQVRDGLAFFGFGAGDAAGTIQFFGDHGIVDVFDASQKIGATLENFGVTDRVRFFKPISGVNYVGAASGGTLTVSFTSGGTQNLTFANPALTDFVHNSVSSTDDEVQIACFRAGTCILTAQGEVPVEQLHAGDRVVTVHGKRLAAVRWIGHRRIATARQQRPRDVWPIRVQAHAFGAGMPHRDLWLSPDHAIHVDGALIPVRYLVNGMTIAQHEVEEVSYFHVELDRHDVLLAEGLPAESYLDTGNRCAFANGGPVAPLDPDFALRTWAALGCAPLVVSGEALTAARRRLLARAQPLGFTLTDDPALHLSVAGAPVWPTLTAQGTWRFVLPPGAREVRICSRAGVPAELTADLPDERRLGVPLAGIRIDGQAIALDDSRLGDGLYALEADAGWRWTDGDARLLLGPDGAADLELTVPFTARYAMQGSGVGRAGDEGRFRSGMRPD